MTEHHTVWDADACIEDLMAARSADMPASLQAPGSVLYLLIDPFLGDPVLLAPIEEDLPAEELNAQRTRAWQRPTFATRLPARLGMDPALAPYLVALEGVDDPWMDTSLQWAIQETVQTWQIDLPSPVAHRVGGWLQSSAQGTELAAHLTEWFRLRTQHPTSARYLRLADRRVLSLTRHVLGDATLSACLHPVQRWHWLDAHAAWATLSANVPQLVADDHTHRVPAQRLPIFDTQQWALMAQGPGIHRQMAQSIAQRLTQSDCTAPARWQPVTNAQWQAALLSARS